MRITRYMARAYRVLDGHGWVSRTEIAAALRIPYSNIGYTLRRLVNCEVVERHPIPRPALYRAIEYAALSRRALRLVDAILSDEETFDEIGFSGWFSQ